MLLFLYIYKWFEPLWLYNIIIIIWIIIVVKKKIGIIS